MVQASSLSSDFGRSIELVPISDVKKLSEIGTCGSSIFGVVPISDVPYSDVHCIYKVHFVLENYTLLDHFWHANCRTVLMPKISCRSKIWISKCIFNTIP